MWAAKFEAKCIKFMASKYKNQCLPPEQNEPSKITMLTFDRIRKLHNKTTPNNCNWHFPQQYNQQIGFTSQDMKSEVPA